MTALRALTVLSMAAFVVAITLPPIFMTPPHIVSGVTGFQRGAWLQPNFVRVAPGSPAFRAGLRTGDVLGCLSVRDYVLLLREARVTKHGYAPGTPIETCVRRGRAVQNIRFIADAGPPIGKPYGTDLLGALRVVVVLVFLFTGIALLLARPSLMTWIFFLFCLGNAPAFPGQRVWTILPSWQFAIAEIPGAAAGVSSALLLLFSLIVPDEADPLWWTLSA